MTFLEWVKHYSNDSLMKTDVISLNECKAYWARDRKYTSLTRARLIILPPHMKQWCQICSRFCIKHFQKSAVIYITWVFYDGRLWRSADSLINSRFIYLSSDGVNCVSVSCSDAANIIFPEQLLKIAQFCLQYPINVSGKENYWNKTEVQPVFIYIWCML